MKAENPIILLRVRDWQSWDDIHTKGDIRSFRVVVAQVVGFLIEEREDCLIIAFEYFEGDETVRHIQAIPKETIIYREILNSGTSY